MIQCIILLLCVYGKIIATKDLTQQDRAKLFRTYNYMSRNLLFLGFS